MTSTPLLDRSGVLVCIPAFRRALAVEYLVALDVLDGQGAISGQLIRFGLSERTAYRWAADYRRFRGHFA